MTKMVTLLCQVDQYKSKIFSVILVKIKKMSKHCTLACHTTTLCITDYHLTVALENVHQSNHISVHMCV